MSDSKKRRLITAWVPVVVWLGVIFSASTDLGSSSHTSRFLQPLVLWINPHTTPDQYEFIHLLVRKAAHLTEYAILGILLLRALRLTSAHPLARPTLRMAGLVVLLGALYAATDEYHQTFVSGRGPSAHDVMIDTCGVMLGLCLSWGIGRRKSRWAKTTGDDQSKSRDRKIESPAFAPGIGAQKHDR